MVRLRNSKEERWPQHAEPQALITPFTPATQKPCCQSPCTVQEARSFSEGLAAFEKHVEEGSDHITASCTPVHGWNNNPDFEQDTGGDPYVWQLSDAFKLRSAHTMHCTSPGPSWPLHTRWIRSGGAPAQSAPVLVCASDSHLARWRCKPSYLATS